MDIVYTTTDAEGDKLDVLAGPDFDSLILRRNDDEAQTVEVDAGQVEALVEALNAWRGQA